MINCFTNYNILFNTKNMNSLKILEKKQQLYIEFLKHVILKRIKNTTLEIHFFK